MLIGSLIHRHLKFALFTTAGRDFRLNASVIQLRCRFILEGETPVPSLHLTYLSASEEKSNSKNSEIEIRR